MTSIEQLRELARLSMKAKEAKKQLKQSSDDVPSIQTPAFVGEIQEVEMEDARTVNIPKFQSDTNVVEDHNTTIASIEDEKEEGELSEPEDVKQARVAEEMARKQLFSRKELPDNRHKKDKRRNQRRNNERRREFEQQDLASKFTRDDSLIGSSFNHTEASGQTNSVSSAPLLFTPDFLNMQFQVNFPQFTNVPLFEQQGISMNQTFLPLQQNEYQQFQHLQQFQPNLQMFNIDLNSQQQIPTFGLPLDQLPTLTHLQPFDFGNSNWYNIGGDDFAIPHPIYIQSSNSVSPSQQKSIESPADEKQDTLVSQKIASVPSKELSTKASTAPYQVVAPKPKQLVSGAPLVHSVVPDESLIIHVDQLDESEEEDEKSQDEGEIPAAGSIGPFLDKIKRQIAEKQKLNGNDSLHTKNGPVMGRSKSAKAVELEKLKQLLAEKEAKLKRRKEDNPTQASNTSSPPPLEVQVTQEPKSPQAEKSSEKTQQPIAKEVITLELLNKNQVTESDIQELKSSLLIQESNYKSSHLQVQKLQEELLQCKQDLSDNKNKQSNYLMRIKMLKAQLQEMERLLEETKTNELELSSKQLKIQPELSSKLEIMNRSKFTLDSEKLRLARLEMEFKGATDVTLLPTIREDVPIKDTVRMAAANNLQQDTKPKTTNNNKIDQLKEQLKETLRKKNAAKLSKKLPQNGANTLSKVNKEQDEVSVAAKKGIEESPIFLFRAYRLSPAFREFYRLKITSPTFTHKLDPYNIICRFELHGVCNDDECKCQHKRDYLPSDIETLEELASYAKLTEGERSDKWKEYLDNLVKLKKMPIEERASSLANKLSKRVERPHYITDTQKPASKLIKTTTTAKRKRDSEPSVSARRSESSHPKKTQKINEESSKSEIDGTHDLLLPGYIPLYDIEYELGNGGDEELLGGRYWQSSKTKNYEELVEQNPKQTSLWIEFAFSKLGNTYPWEQKKRDKALSILARGLENNPTSEYLWEIYIKLYITRISTSDLEESFQNAVRYNPLSHTLWQMYIESKQTLGDKLALVEKAIASFIKDDYSRCYSSFILDLSLTQLKLFCDSGLISNSDTASRAVHTLRFTRKHLSEQHVGLLVLHTAYALLCNAFLDKLHYVPGLTFPIAEWQKNRLDPNRLDMVKDIFNEAITDYQKRKPFPENEDLIYCYTFVHIEQAFQHIEETRVLCQQFLRGAPSSTDLWILYSTAEEYAGNSKDSQLIFDRAFQRYQNGFKLSNLYAELLIKQDKKNQAIIVLAQNILYYAKDIPKSLQSLNNQTALLQSTQNISFIKSVFVSLLRLPGATTIISNYDGLKNQSTYYIWCNYLMFISLTGEDDLTVIFEHALRALKNAKERMNMWIRYIDFFVSTKPAEDQLRELIDKALQDISPVVLDEISKCRKDNEDPRVCRLLADKVTKDYTFHNQIIERYITFLNSSTKKSFTYERCTDMYPDNYKLFIMAADYELSIGNPQRARALLTTCLKSNSTYFDCWKKFIEMEVSEERVDEARALFNVAIKHHPLHLDLWKMFEEFEKKYGTPDQVSSVHASSKSYGLQLSS